MRADLQGGIFWILLGGAIAAESWNMDRLEKLHINPWSAPGVMPGVLGALMMVFGGFLLVRSFSSGEKATSAETSTSRVALALILCVGYAGGLLGRGLPFWLTSAAFMFIAIVAFRWLDRDLDAKPEIRRLAFTSALIAIGAALAIGVLFEQVFLVRLP